MQLKVVVCLVVLLLAAFVAEGRPPTPATPMEVPVLDLAGSTPAKYASLVSSMERLLILTTGSPPAIKGRRPVLGVQRRTAPCFNVVLRSGTAQSATLTLRTDTIYLVGFSTQAGSWYAFKGDEHFVRGSTSLGFKGDYASLTGDGGHKNLRHVVLGKKSAQEALATLAGYTSSTPDEEIKKALTSLVVMLCEATRFAPIRAAVKAAWEDGGKLPQVCVGLVVLWRETSCAQLVWSRNPSKPWDTIREVIANDLKKKGDPLMTTVDEALDNVYLLLRPYDACSDGKTAADILSITS